jgi:FkbM family methyltransferase
MTGIYEQSLINWVASLIDPTKIFLDIGSHVGTYSLTLAKHCAGVHSFECNSKTFNHLCANIALRGLDTDITPHRTALGSRAGTLDYYLYSDDGASNSCLPFTNRHAVSVQVPVATLDSFNLSNIGWIKLDVEGLEQDVLEGGLETLKRSGYPRIIFESWRPLREEEGIPAVRLRDKLFQYLNSINYTIIPIRGWDEMFIAEYINPANPHM